MAVNRYFQPAQYTPHNTYVEYPYEAMMKVGAMKQGKWDEQAKNELALASKFADALKIVQTTSGEQLKVQDYNEAKSIVDKYRNALQYISANIAGGDKTDPGYVNNWNAILSQYNYDWGPNGRIGALEENKKNYLEASKEAMKGDNAGIKPFLHKDYNLAVIDAWLGRPVTFQKNYSSVKDLNPTEHYDKIVSGIKEQGYSYENSNGEGYIVGHSDKGVTRKRIDEVFISGYQGSDVQKYNQAQVQYLQGLYDRGLAPMKADGTQMTQEDIDNFEKNLVSSGIDYVRSKFESSDNKTWMKNDARSNIDYEWKLNNQPKGVPEGIPQGLSGDKDLKVTLNASDITNSKVALDAKEKELIAIKRDIIKNWNNSHGLKGDLIDSHSTDEEINSFFEKNNSLLTGQGKYGMPQYNTKLKEYDEAAQNFVSVKDQVGGVLQEFVNKDNDASVSINKFRIPYSNAGYTAEDVFSRYRKEFGLSADDFTETGRLKDNVFNKLMSEISIGISEHSKLFRDITLGSHDDKTNKTVSPTMKLGMGQKQQEKLMEDIRESFAKWTTSKDNMTVENQYETYDYPGSPGDAADVFSKTVGDAFISKTTQGSTVDINGLKSLVYIDENGKKSPVWDELVKDLDESNIGGGRLVAFNVKPQYTASNKSNSPSMNIEVIVKDSDGVIKSSSINHVQIEKGTKAYSAWEQMVGNMRRAAYAVGNDNNVYIKDNQFVQDADKFQGQLKTEGAYNNDSKTAQHKTIYMTGSNGQKISVQTSIKPFKRNNAIYYNAYIDGSKIGNDCSSVEAAVTEIGKYVNINEAVTLDKTYVNPKLFDKSKERVRTGTQYNEDED